MKLKLTQSICRAVTHAAPGSLSRRAVIGAALLSMAFVGTAVLAPPRALAADAPAKIGIIGSGRIGSALARLWVKAGHPVMLVSLNPEELKPLTQELGSLAQIGTALQAAEYGDVVVISVPFAAVPDVAKEVAAALRGKVVLDTTNPFPPGSDVQKSTAAQGGTGVVHAKQFPGARLVRAFSTMGFNQLPEYAHRSGAQRIAVPLAGDDAQAIAIAEQLVRDAGYDPVLVGPLSSAAKFDMGGDLPRGVHTAAEIRKLLGVKAR